MDLDTFRPTFLIQIEGQDLSKDITQEITSFVFTDNEEELDVLELSVTDRNLQFVDDPLFQEGNEIVARFGYYGFQFFDLTARKIIFNSFKEQFYSKRLLLIVRLTIGIINICRNMDWPSFLVLLFWRRFNPRNCNR